MARTGSKKLIGEFLKRHAGEVVTSKQIQDVVPVVAEWTRRVRELREEDWNISSHKDRTDLKPGEYVLEAEPPKPGESGYRFPRKMSARLRSQVLERNGYTCQMCGIGVGDLAEDGRKVTLHIGYIIDRDHGGKDELSNLRAMCSRCNQGAKNLVQEPPSCAWLLGQVRGRRKAISGRYANGLDGNSPPASLDPSLNLRRGSCSNGMSGERCRGWSGWRFDRFAGGYPTDAATSRERRSRPLDDS